VVKKLALSVALIALVTAPLKGPWWQQACYAAETAGQHTAAVNGLKIPDMVPEHTVSSFIPSEVAPKQGIAVNILYTDKPRYKNGAPIVVVVPGGWGANGLDFDMHASQAGFAEVRFAFPGGGSNELRSGGIYDMRGRRSQQALRDVLRFAAGLTTDSNGQTINQLLPVVLYNKTVGLVGWENGGNIATISLAKYADNLPFVGWLAYYESPIGQAFFPPNLGSSNDLLLNNHYRQGSCATGHCLVDFRNLTYQSDAQKDKGEHRKHGEPEIRGVLFFDENGDKVWEEPLEYALSYLAVPGIYKQIYPPYVISAAIRYRVFGKQWPRTIVTLPEAEAFYRDRDGYLYIKDLVQKLPNCMISIFERTVDQVQRQSDHPHIACLYNSFLSNRALWLRLNPDPVYAGAAAQMNTHNFVNNNINDSIDAAQIDPYLEPEALVPDYVYIIATIAEMSDRKKANKLSDTLVKPIVDYSPGVTTNSPAGTKPSK
jgi:hypothetical protein